MGKAETDRKEFQNKMRQSGYTIPDHFFAEGIAKQDSAEKEAGDGGSSAGDLDGKDSDHGYKGKLLTAEELAEETKKRSASNPANKSETPTAGTKDEGSDGAAGGKKAPANK